MEEPSFQVISEWTLGSPQLSSLAYAGEKGCPTAGLQSWACLLEARMLSTISLVGKPVPRQAPGVWTFNISVFRTEPHTSWGDHHGQAQPGTPSPRVHPCRQQGLPSTHAFSWSTEALCPHSTWELRDSDFCHLLVVD